MTTPNTQVAGTRHYLLIEVETSKAVPDLAEKVAGRAWPLDGVVKTCAMTLTTGQAMRMAMVEAEVLRRG